MANLSEVEAKLSSSPSWIGVLLVNPQSALEEAGLSLDDANETRRLESFVRSTQTQVTLAGKLANFAPSASAEWGIGFGCCNSSCVNSYDTTGSCS